MNLFRAILKIGEKSQRVLQLTEDLLELNPANYTIWLLLLSSSYSYYSSFLIFKGNIVDKYYLNYN